MNGDNVLRVNSVEEETAYRCAVNEVINRIIAEHGATLIDIAEAVDVSVKTISNAFNKKHSLAQVYVARLGKRYGVHVLDPVAALSGGRMVPLYAADEADILPFVARVGLKIAEARDPKSEAGQRETHREQGGYLPDLFALRRELDLLIHRIAERVA